MNSSESNLPSDPVRFFSQVTFHDSGFDGYHTRGNDLLVYVELCNYMQKWFKSGDPEMVTGQLKFHDINEVNFSPGPIPQGAVKHPKDYEILGITTPNAHTVRIDLHEVNFETKHEDYYSISFHAKAVEWLETVGG